MSFFNKRNKIVDERILNASNKIYKEAYFFTIIIALISIIVKFFINGVDYNLVITELIIVGVPAFYYTIRTIQLGIFSDLSEVHDRKSKMSINLKTVIIGFTIGIGVALFFGIRSAILYGDETNRLWYFILVFFASFMIYCPIFVGGVAIFNVTANSLSKKNVNKEE